MVFGTHVGVNLVRSEVILMYLSLSVFLVLMHSEIVHTVSRFSDLLCQVGIYLFRSGCQCGADSWNAQRLLSWASSAVRRLWRTTSLPGSFRHWSLPWVGISIGRCQTISGSTVHRNDCLRLPIAPLYCHVSWQLTWQCPAFESGVNQWEPMGTTGNR